jgi:hypothetical protein
MLMTSAFPEIFRLSSNHRALESAIDEEYGMRIRQSYDHNKFASARARLGGQAQCEEQPKEAAISN